MRFVVESWAPEYGAPTEESALEATDAEVDLDVEVTADRWAPRWPAPDTVPPSPLRFLDGVRRIDARVWLAPSEGGPDDLRQGICASYAAGVVRCDAAATVEGAEVRRALICPTGAAEGTAGVPTPHGTYRHVAAAADDGDRLVGDLHREMTDLEGRVSEQVVAAGAGASGGTGVLVVDGPLRDRLRLPGTVGLVKTHQRAYLQPAAAGTVAELQAGQRTPVFLIGGPFSRWSWYLRLPGDRSHAWAGVVRVEASPGLPLAEVVALADAVSAALPRFASAAHKDPRAPQNLYPIAGLERQLRRRLGDPLLLFRALRARSQQAA